MITILNTSILTNYGEFSYKPITLKEATNLIITHCHNCQNGCPVCSGWGYVYNFRSAIGHQSTAEILTDLFETEISVNRLNYKQEIGESAIVFKLNGRPPEGEILSREQIEKIGYEFGLLTKLK